MPHVDTYFDQTYLKAGHLDGQQQTFTIAEVKKEPVQNQEGTQHKPVIRFQERPERFVVNKTNARRIAALYGTDVGQWIGKLLTIYVTQCEAWGKTTECIRVVEKVPSGNGPKGKA